MSKITDIMMGIGQEALKRKQEERETFKAAIQEGDIPAVEEFFRVHKGHKHLADDKIEIVTNLFYNPKGRVNALALFEARHPMILVLNICLMSVLH